jgi:hypothetical protein
VQQTFDGVTEKARVLGWFLRCVQFEVFVKENDAKRTRALKKERAEVSSRKQKEQEIVALQADLQEHSNARLRALRTVERLAVFEQYLEAVVEASSEFDEVAALLKRHETLTFTNRDLRSIVDSGNEAIEQTRAELAQVDASPIAPPPALPLELCRALAAPSQEPSKPAPQSHLTPEDWYGRDSVVAHTSCFVRMR